MKWILWVLTLTSAQTFASYTTNEVREFYVSARQLSMGGCGVAVANDETAMLVNPAGLGKLRDVYGTIIDPDVDMNSNAMDLYRTKAFTQPWSFEDVVPSLVASPDTYFHFRGQMFPAIVMKNFGIGVYGRRINDGFYNSTTAKVDTFYQDDFAAVVGYNLRIWEGRIKIGVTGRLVNRIELNKQDLDPTAPYDLDSLAVAGDVKSGTGFATDAGILLAAPWTFLPTIGAKMHDVGGTAYNKGLLVRMSNATTEPAVTKQDADVGISIYPIHTSSIRSVWTFEYTNVLNSAQQTDMLKNYHFGVEFNFGDIFFLRAGYNQRYWTGGLELSSEKFQIQLTSYGEEIGTSTSPTEDRRYVGKFSFRF